MRCNVRSISYETQLDFATPGLECGSVVWESSNAQGTLELALQVMQVYEAAMLS